MTALQDKFSALEGALEGELIDRSEEIRCALLALVAGCTYFMVGAPGVAKSMLARRTAARITDAEYYEAQLSKTATPEVLFGPWSLSAMSEDRWERELSGTLATAHLAHLDEVFSAGSMLLENLNWALNERIYRHGTTVIALPLSTVFCSANKVPTDAGIAAFWDRLVLRRSPAAELDGRDFIRMLQVRLVDKPEPVLSWQEVTEAQVAATAVALPETVLQWVYKISRKLAEVGVHASPRRYREAMGVVRASAWLDGRDEACPTDLLVMKDILWQFPDQITTVRQIIERELRNSISPAVTLLRNLGKLRATVTDGLGESERLALAEELGGKLARARTELETLERRAKSTTTAACWRMLQDTENEVLVKLFRSDPAAVGP